MFILWKYNDHGWPDFKELEIPDDLDGEETVEDYLCERDMVPTWSERFMRGRIKWQKITKTPEELEQIKLNKIAQLKLQIKHCKAKIKELSK